MHGKVFATCTGTLTGAVTGGILALNAEYGVTDLDCGKTANVMSPSVDITGTVEADGAVSGVVTITLAALVVSDDIDWAGFATGGTDVDGDFDDEVSLGSMGTMTVTGMFIATKD
jgi:hypothetical protein